MHTQTVENTLARAPTRPPIAPTPSAVPASNIKAEFGRRLQQALSKKGWDQSSLARRASEHMPRGAEIGRNMISKYVRGMSLPGPTRLEALAKALGLKPAERLPARATPSASTANPPIEMTGIGDGLVWLRINQAMSQATAIKIMSLLQADDGN